MSEPSWHERLDAGFAYDARPTLPNAARPVATIISGPNHVLHGILTLFTFWAFGGWAWVWLIVALNDRKRVQVIDANGRVVEALSDDQVARVEFGQRLWIGIGIGLVVFLVLMFVVQGLAAL